MDVSGILTRTVDDCVIILNTIAGYDPKDSTSLTKPYRKIMLPDANKISIKGLKIGIPVEYHNKHLHEEVWETWNEIANLLEENGAAVKEVRNLVINVSFQTNLICFRCLSHTPNLVLFVIQF